MSTLEPRPPYTAAELSKLYPDDLELTKVQILLRHGERTPVNPRFQNAGVPAYWPYCDSINRMRSVIRNADGELDSLTWRRRLETFGDDDGPHRASGPQGEVESVCQPGELTNKGRETTLTLGERIRRLYVDQLGFLPGVLDSKTLDKVLLRSTPIPRARESTEQAFTGIWPASRRVPNLQPPTMVMRYWNEETLFPNEGHCKRFRELAKEFADRTSKFYNDGPEMTYLNNKIGKWMPPESPVVKVDGHPRLSGIMDSTNATLAHGKETRLPSEFYDPKVREHVDRICTEEWFIGYQESNEYRKLGIGAAVGDLTQQMVEHVRSDGKGDDAFKISLNGCHDTTIAATLAALGAFDVEKDKWPNFTANIAIELFKAKDSTASSYNQTPTSTTSGTLYPSQQRTWLSSLTSIFTTSSPTSSTTNVPSARSPFSSLPTTEQSKLSTYFVRLRYNDVPITLPACKPTGKHWRDEESFCTLAAFKQAADSFTPADWRRECGENLGVSGLRVGGVERPPGVV